ncbi:hypothetical protein RCO48_04420 [Peribacillus frigoritolerans]|nr:hypothetical protein [Peribacillus frigoritolerans]
MNNGTITNEELISFLDRETRFGHNRTVYFKDLDPLSIRKLKTMSEVEMEELMKTKGWTRPSKNNLVGTYLPDVLTIAEMTVVPTEEIKITFIETINTLKKININC